MPFTLSEAKLNQHCGSDSDDDDDDDDSIYSYTNHPCIGPNGCTYIIINNLPIITAEIHYILRS